VNVFKIIGGLLIALGFIFRAISLAYFNLREKSLPDEVKARHIFAKKKQRALIIDALFVVVGFSMLLLH